LRARPHALAVRVSIDYPQRARHDAGRGEGNFLKAWAALALLHGAGFRVSIARQMEPGENRTAVEDAYRAVMHAHALPRDRREFMCAYSKMVVKLNGRMRVYACTLVDDDPAYDQGGSLSASLGRRVMLRHHRCFSCFKYGASCSETRGH
jgi:hypothetical protein